MIGEAKKGDIPYIKDLLDPVNGLWKKIVGSMI
jgi:hypothetical protein